MPRSRAITGVLEGFLRTFTSRYSDYDGYWLFGYLVSGPDKITLDLVHEGVALSAHAPTIFTQRLAAERFRDQLTKAGLEDRLLTAQVTLARQAGRCRGLVAGAACNGYRVRVQAAATMDTGRTFRREKQLFVAPHNPDREHRSIRRLPYPS